MHVALYDWPVSQRIPGSSLHYLLAVSGEQKMLDARHDMIVKLLKATRIDDVNVAMLVGPRAAMPSAWSSRAQSIFSACGVPADTVEQFLFTEQGAHDPIPFDPMLQYVIGTNDQVRPLIESWFSIARSPAPRRSTEKALPIATLLEREGVARDDPDAAALMAIAQAAKRDLTTAEVKQFLQMNSEHCRHHIFRASWAHHEKSLFDRVRTTSSSSGSTSPSERYPDIWSAYNDNAAVVKLDRDPTFFTTKELDTGERVITQEVSRGGYVCKAETHNHPTAVSPNPGAATGSGGELRDEAATGLGASQLCGMTAYVTSHLRLPHATPHPWETTPAFIVPGLATPGQIMRDAPIGAADYNNEFGRPGISGIFRTYEHSGEQERGFIKPIMLAGGAGIIRANHVRKHTDWVGALVVVLGGPSLRVGIGGARASSSERGTEGSDRDYASVQRANAEMQRRCQEVIDACSSQGEHSPILSIHDVGAGGLGNAVAELLHDGNVGATIQLDNVPCGQRDLSPIEVWTCEAQERYVMAVNADAADMIRGVAARERCPLAILGVADQSQRLTVLVSGLTQPLIDLPLDQLVSGHRRDLTAASLPTFTPSIRPFDNAVAAPSRLDDALKTVLMFPAVGCKSFLVTIADRTVTGQVSRDQCVGPWQVPVADCGVARTDMKGYGGVAMACGERIPVAAIDPAAASHLALAEMMTNLLSAAPQRQHIRCSANWMADASHPDELTALDTAVTALTDMARAQQIAIPVGKDSLSMKTTAADQDGAQTTVRSPVSVVLTGFAQVDDVRTVITPVLERCKDAPLFLIEPAGVSQGLAGSALDQVLTSDKPVPPSADFTRVPDIGSFDAITDFYDAVRDLHSRGAIVSMHDRSDGGLAATLCEMAFAGRCGLHIELPPAIAADPMTALFHEAPGVVVQIAPGREPDLMELVADLTSVNIHQIGRPNDADRITVSSGGAIVIDQPRVALERAWRTTSTNLQSLRDGGGSSTSDEDYWVSNTTAPMVSQPHRAAMPGKRTSTPPVVGILRDQGTNGHREMSMAFLAVGAQVRDIHVSELMRNPHALDGLKALVLPGGFSFGDTLGAGRGTALSILNHPTARDQLTGFLAQPNSLLLGICNGCQILSNLTSLFPKQISWPSFLPNASRQYEARLVQVSLAQGGGWLKGVGGMTLSVPSSHGEGRAFVLPEFDSSSTAATYRSPDGTLAHASSSYPYNPNGSIDGIAGVQALDGRVLALMPHPERAVFTTQLSHAPREWRESDPTIRGQDTWDRQIAFQSAHTWHPNRSGTWRDHTPWLALFEAVWRD